MGTILDDELVYNILSVVEDIPEGRVASYGGIARMIGRPKNGCVDMKKYEWTGTAE